MCVAAFLWNPGASEPLLLAANRDEFRARPSAPLARWPEGDLVGGRDLESGGTWLAVAPRDDGQTLRFGLVTNIRNPAFRKPGAPSRGLLLPDFLRGAYSPMTHLHDIASSAGEYEGFNLLVGEIGPGGASLAFLNSLEGRPRLLAAGLYAVSNASLDTPWPKVVRLRQALAHARAEREPSRRELRLLRALANRQCAPDSELPRTGVPIEWERTLSSVFIDRPEYGTRASTVITIEASGRVAMLERTWHPDGSFTDARASLPPWTQSSRHLRHPETETGSSRNRS
ncbi:MAG: NRDE family protein [Casimicrobiaceae bacterium]